MTRSTFSATSPARSAQLLPRLALLLTMPLALAGCFNSSDAAMTLDLGSVSVGQQLMDLDAAKEAGAISKAEHRMIRDKIIKGIAALEIEVDEDNDAVEIMLEVGENNTKSESENEEDGFNWF
ncbi:MAG: hypothetical protein AB8B93_06560 [Pseudomonadales bacterium]